MSVRIGLGISTFPFSNPKVFWRWVDLCERGDVDSLWQTDRLQSREPFLEAMSTMAALAGATEKLKFGMNAVVIAVRDPLVLAKQCATIDFLSGGRLLPVFGVGGAKAPEFAATGRDPKERGRRANEALTLLARLWSEESVTFEGEFYHYQNAAISPRPVQQPLPLWIGGSSRAAIRRTARLGTGWLGGLQSPKQVAPVIQAIKSELSETGRRIDDDHYGAGLLFRFGSRDDAPVQALARARSRLAPDLDPENLFAVGGADEIITRCREYIDAGVSKFVAIPLASGDDELFDQTQRLTAEVIPAICN